MGLRLTGEGDPTNAPHSTEQKLLEIHELLKKLPGATDTARTDSQSARPSPSQEIDTAPKTVTVPAHVYEALRERRGARPTGPAYGNSPKATLPQPAAPSTTSNTGDKKPKGKRQRRLVGAGVVGVLLLTGGALVKTGVVDISGVEAAAAQAFEDVSGTSLGGLSDDAQQSAASYLDCTSPTSVQVKIDATGNVVYGVQKGDGTIIEIDDPITREDDTGKRPARVALSGIIGFTVCESESSAGEATAVIGDSSSVDVRFDQGDGNGGVLVRPFVADGDTKPFSIEYPTVVTEAEGLPFSAQEAEAFNTAVASEATQTRISDIFMYDIFANMNSTNPTCADGITQGIQASISDTLVQSPQPLTTNPSNIHYVDTPNVPKSMLDGAGADQYSAGQDGLPLRLDDTNVTECQVTVSRTLTPTDSATGN